MDQIMALTADTQFKHGTQRRVFPAGTVVIVHKELSDGDVLVGYGAWNAIILVTWLREVTKAV